MRARTIAALLVIAAVLAIVVALRRRKMAAPVVYTVGDIRAMHADVLVGGKEVRGMRRLADGDAVKTGPDGRARIRLDDGTLVVVDASTAFTLHGAAIALDEGRLFVQGGALSRTEVSAGNAATTVSSSAAAFETHAAGARSTTIYCAQGELMVRSNGRQEHVASGETASIGGGLSVRPEAAFDDWTGGLAVPWSGESSRGGAVAELWGGAGQGSAPGTPLVVRTAKVDVTVDGEVAITRARTTYFNGSEGSIAAEVRMALPPGAIVSRVLRSNGSPASADVQAVLLPTKPEEGSSIGRLEWAGGGYLRGFLPDIAAGATTDLLVEYVEWLPVRNGRATYRFPLGASSEPPSIGELSAEVNAEKTSSPWLTASAGASVAGRTVTLRGADVRPTSDLVVEVAPEVVRAGAARAYVAEGEKGEDPYVLIRTEVPDTDAAGIALAVVVDTSTSVGAASLEVERAVVDALLEGLGSRDKLVVLAADQRVRAIGPSEPQAVTAELRERIRKDLATLRPGGATDIGAALERAADVLDAPSSAPSGAGMVVYVGDGRPTVGEESADGVRKRLARRVGGVPRLGAISVGPGADRWMLARLVSGSGPVYEALDRSDAAQVGAALLADALEPTLRDVDLDLGSTIDRIYPREARAALSGSTVTVAGRLRGRLPERIGFRFRKGATLVREVRPLTSIPVPAGADVARRWAAARIEEMAARGDGIEPAVAIAAKAKLLTPWTSWFFTGQDTFSAGAPLARRVLELSPALDAPYAARVEPSLRAASLLLEPPRSFGGGVSLREAVEMAARREIEASLGALVACRDARAAVRPDVSSSLRIDLSVDGRGRATRVHVAALGTGDDPVLDRCAETVVTSLTFFDSGLTVSMTHQVALPERRASLRTRCSPAAALPLAVRRGLWQWDHCSPGAECAGWYVAKARLCELPGWRDRRDLLELVLKSSTSEQALSTAAALEAAGEPDAAAYLRKETLRRVTTVAELETVRRIVLREEPDVDDELEKAYGKAKTDEERLAVVRRFLRIAPHSALGRRHLFALLEALGRRDALVEEIEHARGDPFADAGLLAAGASALRRVGLDDEGRRAFGELIERAPGDPWTLGYVGDRLRGEGLFDEATAAYESLDRALPDEPAVLLRLGLAHAGSGRVDVATRILDRVAQTGGRGDDGHMGELASMTEAVLLAAARNASPGADTDAQLVRRLVQTPVPDVASIVVVRSPPADDPVEVRVVRDASKDEDPADLDAADMGLSAIRIERGQGGARIRLRRAGAGVPVRPTRATVAVLVLADDRAASRLVTRDVDVRSGDGVELRWNGEALL